MPAERMSSEPLGFAIHVKFFFPDGDTNFEFFDNVAAHLERFISVRGVHDDDHTQFTHLKFSCAVLDENSAVFRPFFLRFGGDVDQRFLCERDIRVVADRLDLATMIDVSDNSEKGV